MVPYFEFYASCIVAIFFFEQLVEWRQYVKHQIKEMPTELTGIVDSAEFESSQRYQGDKRIFNLISRSIDLLIEFGMLLAGHVWAWDIAETKLGLEGYYKAYAWVVILGWMTLPKEIIEGLCADFILEEKHGFNKKTVGIFITDLIKSQIISLIAVGVILPGCLYVITWGGESFWLYLWGFLQAMVFLFIMIWPNFIAPLFNEFKPLQDMELKAKIEKLAASLNFPLTELYEIDGSKRSGHSNAYFFGFGKRKRIVLYDTLLHLSHDKVLAILCHELGHWMFYHFWMNLALVSANLGSMVFLFNLSVSDAEMYKAFGFTNARDLVIGLIMFQKVFVPAEALVMRVVTANARRNEYMADGFAHTQGRADQLGEALKDISRENKGSLCPDPWYAWYHYTHPSLLERLRALDELKKKKA
jgi:STE24 endopeptidase